MPDRRRFLHAASLAALGLAAAPVQSLARMIERDPYAPLPARLGEREPGRAVRARGAVRTPEGAGIGGVAVTDGLSVTTTRPDGTFTLVTTSRQPFLYLSVPAGYALGQNPTGTARFYQPLRPDAIGEAEATFTLTPQPRLGDHTFVVIADPQTETMGEIRRFQNETVPSVKSAIRAASLPVAFGVADGDIMFDDLALYPEYERAVAAMGVPFFQAVGNHDIHFDALTDEDTTLTFRQHFGPTYYSFDRGAAHYVVLDDVLWHGTGYVGYLDAGQLAWLAQDLARVEAGRPVVVFCHIPAYSSRGERSGGNPTRGSGAINNREALYRLLEPYEAHLISGHHHEVDHVFEGSVHEWTCGAACGAWWSGDIGYDGSPNGFGVVEMRGEAVRWRFQATGRAADHQLRAYAPGADTERPGDLVANVFDADPEWSVVWHEGSDRRGALAAGVGLDPLSAKQHRGEAIPAHRPWVEPILTRHLFYAALPEGTDASAVTVEATDRFGRTYSAGITTL